jgi:hypothetical protein
MRLAAHVASVRDSREVHVGFWRGNLRERDYLEDLGVDGMVYFRMDLQEIGWPGPGLD